MTQSPLPLSVFIITRDEADRIARSITAIAGLTDDIVVVDSGSTDGTPEIAAQLGARVASVAPGIIDTDMQRQLRAADPARFPERARFDEFHRSGALSTPAQAAARLLALLESVDYGSEPVTDARE